MCALRIRRNLARIVSALALACLLAATASAYTVVMKGGRRIEIPSNFVVTAATVTYEVSAGIQITLNLAAIDVAATEKANHESAGSFLRRITTESNVLSRQESSGRSATHTITNRDLESSSRRRQESELAYERRRKELGLPSVAESRRKAEAESALIGTELQQTGAAETELEGYWRARASALRTEIATVDAELNYVRRQLDEALFPSTNGSFTTLVNVVPFPSFGQFGRGPFARPVSPRPGIFVAPQGGTQRGGRFALRGGSARGQVFPNPSGFHRVRPLASPLLAPPNLTVFDSPGFATDYAYERSELVTQLNQLAATRAGLSARWRALEDEARRAGAPPGWLRP